MSRSIAIQWPYRLNYIWVNDQLKDVTVTHKMLIDYNFGALGHTPTWIWLGETTDGISVSASSTDEQVNLAELQWKSVKEWKHTSTQKV